MSGVRQPGRFAIDSASREQKAHRAIALQVEGSDVVSKQMSDKLQFVGNPTS